MNNKKTAKSWLILGVVFIAILFLYVYLVDSQILYASYGAETLISAIFGGGGILFFVIGVIKLVIEKFRK